MTQLRIGIDTGGTFTDVMAMDEKGRVWGKKVPSTPTDFSACFLAGVEAVLSEYPSSRLQPSVLLHGTTVAANALLEERFPALGLIVTQGFRELLETTQHAIPGEQKEVQPEPRPPRIVPLEVEGCHGRAVF